MKDVGIILFYPVLAFLIIAFIFAVELQKHSDRVEPINNIIVSQKMEDFVWVAMNVKGTTELINDAGQTINVPISSMWVKFHNNRFTLGVDVKSLLNNGQSTEGFFFPTLSGPFSIDFPENIQILSDKQIISVGSNHIHRTRTAILIIGGDSSYKYIKTAHFVTVDYADFNIQKVLQEPIDDLTKGFLKEFNEQNIRSSFFTAVFQESQ